MAASPAKIPARTLAAVCLTFLCANGAASSFSVIFSAFVNERGFSLYTTGVLTTAMMGGIALGSTFSLPLLVRRRYALGSLVRAVMVLLLAVQLLSSVATSAGAFFTLELASGICTGVIQAAGAAWIGQISSPERAFAFYLGSTYLSGVIGMPVFGYFASHGGLRAVFLSFSGALVIGWLIALKYPERWDHVERQAPGPSVLRRRYRAEFAVLVSILLNYATNGGLWVYLEEVGRQAGFTPVAITTSLSVGMAAACGSTLIVAALGVRAGRGIPLLVAHVCLILGPALMIGHPTLGVYSLGVVLFHVGFSAVGPYLLGMLAVLDPSGRAPVRGIAATNVGFSFGSWSLTLLVAHWGYEVMLAVCAGTFAVCGALVLAAARARSRARFAADTNAADARRL